MSPVPPPELSPPSAVTSARLPIDRGRRVLWAILVFILVIPAVNLKQLMDERTPVQLLDGALNLAFVVGMFASVILVLFWYFAYRGQWYARITLGVCYLLATAVVLGLPFALYLGGMPTPKGWPFVLIFGSLYGLVGWVLLASDNIKAFQRHQQRVRAGASGA